jgi:hypothetical protein
MENGNTLTGCGVLSDRAARSLHQDLSTPFGAVELRTTIGGWYPHPIAAMFHEQSEPVPYGTKKANASTPLLVPDWFSLARLNFC